MRKRGFLKTGERLEDLQARHQRLQERRPHPRPRKRWNERE
jgi:hypothetical protein